MKKNTWKTLKSKEVYKNPWLRVREDDVIRPDGKRGIYSVVELPHSAGIVAMNEEGKIALVGQWRYANGLYSWEIPTGSLDGRERPVQAARRELREECGFSAAHWVSLGAIQNSNGATTDIAHLFLATGLKSVGKRDFGEGITMKWMPFTSALERVMSGRIRR